MYKLHLLVAKTIMDVFILGAKVKVELLISTGQIIMSQRYDQQ
jgi:hypothetical protein